MNGALWVSAAFLARSMTTPDLYGSISLLTVGRGTVALLSLELMLFD